MTEERDKLFTARPPPGDGADVYSASTVAGQAPADLLELVRAAEEAATLAVRDEPAEDAAGASDTAPAEEEVVDVSNEAIDAPPSLPPMRAATPGTAFAPTGAPAEAKEPAERTAAADARGAGLSDRSAHGEPPAGRALPPAVGIAVVLALTIGALVAFVR